MIKFQYEKTSFGYNAWAKKSDSKAYVYFGHFLTKKEAVRTYYAAI